MLSLNMAGLCWIINLNGVGGYDITGIDIFGCEVKAVHGLSNPGMMARWCKGYESCEN